MPRPAPPSPLADALAQQAFVTTAVLSRVAAAHELSLTQIRVLGILRDRQVGVTALAAFLGLEKSTMSGLVDRAEKRGLVQRRRDPGDGRAVVVVLTAAGRRLAVAGAAEVAAGLAPLTARLTPAQAAELTALLGVLHDEPAT